MRWRSWFVRWRQRRLTVAGLAIRAEGCALVILAGSAEHPDAVCCAERLDLPQAWVVHGQVLQTDALATWLRDYLAHAGHRVDAFYLGLDDTCISQQRVSLAAGLSDDDVAFQLQAEVQAMVPAEVQSGRVDPAPELYMDYVLEEAAENASTIASTIAAPNASVRSYVVYAIPRAQVQAWREVITSVGSCLRGVESAKAAALRTQQSRQSPQNQPMAHVFAHLSSASMALALQCDEAFGLALRAWRDDGLNFLPHRQERQHAQRRDWGLRMVAGALGGVVLATGLTWLSFWMADQQALLSADVQAVARAHRQAQQAHAQANAQQQRLAEHMQWMKERHAVQAQTLQWSRVLNHAGQGVWIANVKQQGAQWMVQGEALSASDAKQLMRQLTSLEVWKQAPELPLLQVMPTKFTTGIPVWQFRIEGQLKVGHQ